MDMKLSENIYALRRQRALTQEQLAEVLGVSVGAVYKWEAGLSVPELDRIVEMADFFDTSVDALLGYQIKDNRLAAALRRINELGRLRSADAIAEAEKALKKYPNSFEAVHDSASVYFVFGSEEGDAEKLRRARDLLEQARLLIGQNEDPEISDLTLCGELAEVLFQLGERETALTLLKKNNVGGLFNDSIGAMLSIFLNRPEEAEPFLAKALLQGASTLLNTVVGYVPVFCARNDPESARQIVLWGLNLLRGIRKDNRSGFLDKTGSELLVLLALTQLLSGEREAAERSVREALALARRFDADPDYGFGTVRFASIPDSASFYDSLGATAAESLEAVVCLTGNRELAELWKEVCQNE